MSYCLRPRPGQSQQPQDPQNAAAAFESDWSLPGNAPSPSRGLKNEGNYCYLNSVLVALMHCAVFVNWLASHAKLCRKLSCVACAINTLATAYWQADVEPSIIEDALELLRIKFRLASWTFVDEGFDFEDQIFPVEKQQDALDFYNRLVRYMQEQLPNQLGQLQELFNITMVQALICPACGRPSSASSLETSLGIPLERASSLAKLLRSEAVFGTETVQAVTCASAICSHHSDRNQIRSFRAPPKILVVQLRRFEYDRHTNTVGKNPVPIGFPSTLDLSPFAENDERVLYHLKSVVQHQGSLVRGHYIGYGLGPRGSWSQMNDLQSRRSNFKEASSNNDGNGFTPYLLFYQRQEPLRRQPIAETIAAADPGKNRVFEVMNDQLDSAERQLKRNRKAKEEERLQRRRLRRT